MESRSHYFGGIEGGGSKSRMVLVDERGRVVAETEGEDTNHFCIGYEECGRRLFGMVQSIKAKVGLGDNEAITALGLSLCGIDYPENAAKVLQSLEQWRDKTAEYCYACNDTLCPIFTSSNSGGMVLIAGTGSNCNFTDRSGESFFCGGYSKSLGSEGSASWIALNSIKTILAHDANLRRSSFDTQFVKDAIYRHFQVSSNQDLVQSVYSATDSFFAKLCEELSRGASELADPLCCSLFDQAGFMLARHVLALVPRVDQEFFIQPGGLHVVCVGSVWDSWQAMRKGFIDGISSRTYPELKEVSLVRLKVPAAIGAAYLGAKHAGYFIPLNHKDNIEVFFRHVISPSDYTGTKKTHVPTVIKFDSAPLKHCL